MIVSMVITQSGNPNKISDSLEGQYQGTPATKNAMYMIAGRYRFIILGEF